MMHSPFHRLALLTLLVGCMLGIRLQGSNAVAAEEPTTAASDAALRFDRDVLPIFKAKCVECHNTDSRKAELDLSSAAGLAAGSESGSLVEPGKVDESLLFDMVDSESMPPEGEEPLTAAELKILKRWIISGAAGLESAAASNGEPEVTQHDVLQITRLRCTVCHGPRKQEGELDLSSVESMLAGGKSGPAFVLDHPEESLALEKMKSGEMPPKKMLIAAGVKPVEAGEIELISKWLSAGAPVVEITPDVANGEPDPLVTDEERQFWSFQSPTRPPVPESSERDEVINPIDAFVLEKLAEQGLRFSPEADRLTLIRRATYDLTGLPPDPEEVAQFVSDERPDAYERLIDRLLDSPHYGERYARYWLDLAGYADSEGKRSADPIRPNAYRYRDYVIRSLNADKPYDRFLVEQLAGDELADYEHAESISQEMMDNLVATAFLRMAPDGTGSDIVNTVVERMEVIADEINIFSSVVMGLTMKCAQCHSHKYDPIPQRDYYRLKAVFQGAYDEHDWLRPTSVANQSKSDAMGRRYLAHVTDKEREAWEKHNAELERKIAAKKAARDSRAEKLTNDVLDEQLVKLPEALHDDLRKMLATPDDERSEVQKYLAEKFEAELTVDESELRRRDDKFTRLDRELKDLQATVLPEPVIRALWDRGEPSPTYINLRGDPLSPGRLVGPGVPSVLCDDTETFDVQPPWPGATQTGRRLALARWVTEPDHPLTSRVMVNRLWKYHFGRGIVASLDNFGKLGTPPTHPDLLDWLAVEFVDRGWSMKAMHRLMMTSRTYRQSSTLAPEHERVDPENLLYARMPIRRLEAEVVRDAILAVAGQLDETPFGPPDAVDVRPDGLVTSVRGPNGWRRSIYVQQRRKTIPTILENFDLPQMIPNCIQRNDSIVASQALHLMNNGMIRELADDFAERVLSQSGSDPYEQVERVFWLSFGRAPSAEERNASLVTLSALAEHWAAHSPDTIDAGAAEQIAAEQALGSFCHAILNSAAFLYVD